MTPIRMRLATLALCAVAAPCHAESLASSASSAGSSASSASSASSGSVSDSLTNSSRSSGGTQTTADGDYRVIDVAEPAGSPGMLQLTLRATAPDAEHEFSLKLPRRALAPRGIAAGDVVQVRNHDYGLEFARADGAAAREPFFLVLYDDWQRELAARPVAL